MTNCKNISQASLPFDYGFFTPQSIINFLESETCEFNLHNTSPVTKNINWKEGQLNEAQLKCHFKTTSYEKINDYLGYTDSGGMSSAREKRNGDTRWVHAAGTKYPVYYTLCKDYGFVMANYVHTPWSKHYNGGLEQDFRNVTSMMSRRKIRLLELMKGATTINLYIHEGQGFKRMGIDGIFNNIMEDRHVLHDYIQQRYPDKTVNMIVISPNRKPRD